MMILVKYGRRYILAVHRDRKAETCTVIRHMCPTEKAGTAETSGWRAEDGYRNSESMKQWPNSGPVQFRTTTGRIHCALSATELPNGGDWLSEWRFLPGRLAVS